MNTTMRRICAALTRAGLPCRAPAVRGRDFCAIHHRLGAGVACWGGPFDAAEIHPPGGGLLESVIAVVRDAMGFVTCARPEAIGTRVVLGWYVLASAAPGLWRYGLRYLWRAEVAR